MLNFIHGSNLKKRYEIVSKLVGKNKKVFEPACGTSITADYLDTTCDYEGWDLNKGFIKYCRRKGRDVKLKDIFDFKDYPESDIIVIIDVLHHVLPRHDLLLENARKYCKKLIIVEPFIDRENNKMDFLKHSKNKFVFNFFKIFNLFFGDNDGINNTELMYDWEHDEKSLRNYFNRRGAEKIIKSKFDLIGVFLKD